MTDDILSQNSAVLRSWFAGEALVHEGITFQGYAPIASSCVVSAADHHLHMS